MSEQKKRPAEPGGEKRHRFSIGKIFFHNTFVLAFSFVVAVISWFMVSASSSDRGVTISNVPVEVRYSAAAQEEGLQVFHMSDETVDLQVLGNNLLTTSLTASDFEVSVTLNPSSTTVTGNTLQKMTVEVQAVKSNSLASYEITGVSPQEITVEYDRSLEVNLPIESNIQYSSDSGFYAGTPILSADNVTISGPESSVSRISRVAVNYQVEDPLREEASFTCPLTFYDENGQELLDISGMYLTMNVESVDVSIPVIPVKTVDLVAATVHQPTGFSSDRIQIEPSQITIAGSSETLSSINKIQLDTVIDFAQLDVDGANTFTSNVTLPSGVRNIGSSGEISAQASATVTVNLNGYTEKTVTVSNANVQIVNATSDMEVEQATTALSVTVLGPEAQVARLTGDNVSVLVDLTNFQDQTGTVEVPATVAVTGTQADSCWVTGDYTISVTISEAATSATARVANAGARQSSKEDAVAATPQD